MGVQDKTASPGGPMAKRNHLRHMLGHFADYHNADAEVIIDDGPQNRNHPTASTVCFDAIRP
jgi:hypothetical protein